MIRIENSHVLVLLGNHFLDCGIIGVHFILNLFELLRQLLDLLSQLVSVFDWRALELR